LLCMRSKMNFVCHFHAWKDHSTVRERSADPRDKILGLIWTAPVVQDRFCFNSPNNDVVNEILICNSFTANTSVRLFRKRTSLSRFEIFRNLCPSCTVATIPTSQRDFSCHFLSYIFACDSLEDIAVCVNADFFFVECPLVPFSWSFSVYEWLNYCVAKIKH